jgi:hypothetical protein
VQSLAEHLEPADRERLNILLEAVAAALPVEMIYSDYSTSPREIRQHTVEEGDVLDRLRRLRDTLFNGSRADPDSFREVLRSVRLFDKYSEITERFIREELK